MNGYDGVAREAFEELRSSLSTCRDLLMMHYWALPSYRLEDDGQDILEKVNSIDKALNGLNAVNNDMEDAGIE